MLRRKKKRSAFRGPARYGIRAGMEQIDAIATLTLNPALDIATTTPRIAPTEKLRCAAPQIDPGGGGINVARVIHELGGRATALFPAGGPSGQTLGALLDAEGIACAPVPIDGLTRESFSVTEAETGLQYRFVLPGPALPEAAVAALLARLAALDPPPRWLVVSGSFPPGLPGDFAARLGDAARRAGARVILDTGSGLAEAGAALGAWLIKPNRGELEEAAGHTLDDSAAIADAARVLIERGAARRVVVSLGAEGGMLVGPDTLDRVAAPRVTPVSAVGAGDSMVGAMTLALASGAAPAEALRRGIAAGAAALLTPATRLVHRDDVARLYAEMAAG